MRTQWADIRLAARLLLKYPALTMVGGLSMSVAVAALAGTFAITGNLLDPTLPFPDGERVVSVQNWDVTSRTPDGARHGDYLLWRDELRSIEDLGAFESDEREVVREGGPTQTFRVAAVTAGAFEVAQTPPVLGRYLGQADEEAGASRVVVIGAEVWEDLFAGSRTVIGQTLRISGSPHEVVGVMPEGFGFPLNHAAWVPLRFDLSASEGMAGPILSVFGRLAQGFDLDGAQAELSLLGRRSANASPQTHANLRPRVLPYAQQWIGTSRLGFAAARLGLVILLLVIVANVGALVLARTLTREGEIAVRRALGASRGQIVVQLTVEALFPVILSAAAGLAAASWGVSVVSRVMADTALGVGGLPFWWQDGLTPGTIWWVGTLAVVSTLLCGALPAILLTNQREWGTLQRAGSSNWSPQAGMGLKAVVAAQFALSVGLLTMAVAEWPDMVKNEESIDGLSSDAYLTAVVHVRDGEPEVAPGRESAEDVALVHQALLERLRVEPGVAGATIATALPGMLHPQVRTQTDKVGDTPDDHPIRYSAVGPAFFDVMGIRVRAGRAFSEQDFSNDAPRSVVVVNESYARERLGGTAVIGRRIRFARRTGEGGDWREVIGVVQDFGMNSIDPSRPAGVYIPLDDAPRSVSLAVRTPDVPAQFAPRLRSLGAGPGPLVAIQRVQPLDQVIRSNRAQRRMEYVAVAVGTIAVILLTMGGLSAVTSFFVSHRTHEMGIRTALGARPARVALDIYSGAVRRLGWGVIVGVPTGIALGSVVLEGGSVMVSLKVSVALIAVALLACVPATRRLLAVDPVDAIRGEA